MVTPLAHVLSSPLIGPQTSLCAESNCVLTRTKGARHLLHFRGLTPLLPTGPGGVERIPRLELGSSRWKREVVTYGPYSRVTPCRTDGGVELGCRSCPQRSRRARRDPVIRTGIEPVWLGLKDRVAQPTDRRTRSSRGRHPPLPEYESGVLALPYGSGMSPAERHRLLVPTQTGPDATGKAVRGRGVPGLKHLLGVTPVGFEPTSPT